MCILVSVIKCCLFFTANYLYISSLFRKFK
nr:MAG TPA: hypothetical protein [Caudoviricetes sp.]